MFYINSEIQYIIYNQYDILLLHSIHETNKQFQWVI